MKRIIGTCEYEDFLKNVDIVGGELAWITQGRDFTTPNPGLNDKKKRTSSDLINAVLNSARVKAAVEMKVETEKVLKSAVEDEAEQIIYTMAHKMQLLSVRAVGYAVVKALKTLFDAIYINISQLSALKNFSQGEPIVFMPTHRSYLDFLIMSILCFDQQIPLPAIASAMDFMNSKLIGETLRRCGAFFIRRRVGNDSLYWAIFTEYIQTHVINADHPLEFFIEGTRSRSNKSLYPKFGLLQILLEPFFRKRIYDLTVVPVVINYDKIVEECLFACESLGFSKPKESASGLFKARRVLNERFGRVFVTFGNPVSARDYFKNLNILSPFCSNLHGPESLSAQEKVAVKSFGHFVVQCHNSMDVVCIWPYVSFLLLQAFQKKRSSGQPVEISVRKIMCDLGNLIGLAEVLGKSVVIINGLSKDLLHFLELHSELFFARSNCSSLDSLLQPARFCVGRSKVLDKVLVEEAVVYVLLWCYSNQIMPSFANLAILCSMLRCQKSLPICTSFHHYFVLRQLFDHEFVCLSKEDNVRQMFSDAVDVLTRNGIIIRDNGQLQVKDSDKIQLLSAFVEPYLYSYQVLLDVTLCFAGSTVSSETLLEGSQRRLAELLSSNEQIPLQCLSAEPLRNAVASLSAKGALVKQEGNNFFVDDLSIAPYANSLRLVAFARRLEIIHPKSKL